MPRNSSPTSEGSLAARGKGASVTVTVRHRGAQAITVRAGLRRVEQMQIEL